MTTSALLMAHHPDEPGEWYQLAIAARERPRRPARRLRLPHAPRRAVDRRPGLHAGPVPPRGGASRPRRSVRSSGTCSRTAASTASAPTATRATSLMAPARAARLPPRGRAAGELSRRRRRGGASTCTGCSTTSGARAPAGAGTVRDAPASERSPEDRQAGAGAARRSQAQPPRGGDRQQDERDRTDDRLERRVDRQRPARAQEQQRDLVAGRAPDGEEGAEGGQPAEPGRVRRSPLATASGARSTRAIGDP